MKRRRLLLSLIAMMLLVSVAFPAAVMAEEEMQFVYAQVPADWEAPCLWAWADNGDNAFDEWPGGSMIADENNEGWYYIWIPTWATNIIVNANEGTVQTSDMPITGNCWVSVADAENAEVSYDALTEGETPEHVEMYVFYAQVPEDWAAPCLWAWSDDGENAFDAWPGGEMTMDEANDGWYYCYLPVWATNIIVNANEGTVQTSDMPIAGDTWAIVKDAETVELSTEALTDGDAPEYVEMITVYAQVPTDWETIGLWAWSAPDGTNAFDAWPGAAMKMQDNGWAKVSAPAFINSIIINGNEGSVQTSDISVDAGMDIWVAVNDDLSYELTYEDPALSADIETIRVHAQVPEDWDSPCLWAWSAPDGTNAFDAWPGEALTEDEGWMIYDVPNWVNSVIINGNEGTVQTTDISVEAGKDIWLVVPNADEYSLTYEEPTEEIAEEETLETEEVVESVTEPVEEEKGSLVWLYSLIGAVVVIGAGSAVVIKRKKNNKG